MAREQAIANDVLPKAVAEATRAAIQAMAAALAERPQSMTGPKNRWTCHVTVNIQLEGRWQNQQTQNLQFRSQNILTMYKNV